MFKNTATTVTEYLAALPPERRSVIAAMREFMRKHIPHGYEEGIQWGAITWCVPLAQYPNTYNGQPLCYVGLGAKKSYNSLYLMGVYNSANGEYTTPFSGSCSKTRSRKPASGSTWGSAVSTSRSSTISSSPPSRR